MNLIRVYEHESLKVNKETFKEDEHLRLLSKFLGEKVGEDAPFSLIHNGVKFKQFVGVISVGDLQIEVLPKADKNAGDKQKDIWESHLMEMLKAVYKLKVKLPSKADQQVKRSPVLDIFLDRFMDEVERLMHIGLVKAYRRVEDNRTALKGRLVMSKHIIKNLVHKERFYVEYTTYDRNHIFNRLLYKALRVIPDISTHSYTHSRAKTLMFEFPELNDIVVTDALFSRLSYDRKTEDYRDAIELAKLILLNYMPNLTHQRGNSVFALMFDMNRLWEEYVFIILRRQLKDYSVLAQNSKPFWHSSKYSKPIRPDILVMKENECVAVLDTKWKCPDDTKPSDADLKQMYVYHDYWNTVRTALIYPGASEKVEGHFVKDKTETAECSMLFLPIKSDSGPQFLDIDELFKWLP